MVDSFGFEVMSLRQLHAELGRQLREKPELADKPVWIDNCPPLKWPIKLVAIPKDRTRGLALLVERGGN